MATYQKRGYKRSINTTVETPGEQSTTQEVFSTLDETAGKTEAWVAKNQQLILIAIGVVVFTILGYLAYQQFIISPKEKEASNEMFHAQQYFEQAVNDTKKDSLYGLALHGADGKYGFLDIIENYSGTKVANLANYSAGMAYLNLKKYKEAITYLQEFSSDDPILGALSKGGIGDAFVQVNQPNDALEYYKQAIAHSDNNFTTPKFLFKAGVLSMQEKNVVEALEYFNIIKNDYPDSEEGRTIDIYIGKVENMNN